MTTHNAMAEKFAADRLAAFGRGDIETLIAQYADDATVLGPAGVLHGKAQIRGMIEAIVREFAQPGVRFELISQNAVGPIVSFAWSATTGANTYELGAETYVIAEGRATHQTFAAKVTPH
jgi:ketosteroid isomerase-like protein